MEKKLMLKCHGPLRQNEKTVARDRLAANNADNKGLETAVVTLTPAAIRPQAEL